MNGPDFGSRKLSAAVGLFVLGVAALVVASWVLADDLADVGPGRGWIRAFTIAIAVGVAAVAALRHRPVAALTWALAAVALGITVWAVIGFVSQYDTGFPGRCTLLAAVGGVAVAVGAMLILPVPAARWRQPRGRDVLWSIGAMVLVALVGTPLLLIAPDWRLHATTSAAGKPAAIPSEVTRVVWSTEVDGPVEDVAATRTGAVVMLSDGVLGVDGTTGEIRWSRRRSGAEAEQIDVSPDGRTVLVQMSPKDRFPIRREVLDAATGKLRFVVDNSNSAHSLGFVAPMTNVSYIRAKADQSVFYGNSLMDGRTLWTFHPPAGCRIIPGISQQFAQANGMLLPLACGDQEFRYVSVDAATGKLRWQHIVRLASPTQHVEFVVERSTDHKLAGLYVMDTARSRYVVLDTDNGHVLPAPSNLDLRSSGLGIAGSPKRNVLIDVRSGRVLARKGDLLNCAMDAGPTLLTDGALCVDQARKPFDGFMTSGTVALTFAQFGEHSLRPLSVQLGGPFVEKASSGELFQSVPVAGAVIAYSQFTPASGHRSRIVGLR